MPPWPYPDPRIHASVTPHKPEGFTVWPGFSRCMKSLRELLKRTITVASSFPSEQPPFRSRSICVSTRTVVNVPAAFDAAANVAGIALAGAEGVLTGVTTTPLIAGVPPTGQGALNQVQLLTPAAAAPPFEALPVWQYRTPQGFVTVFRHWGISVESGDPEAAVVTAEVPGPSNGTMGPDPQVSGALSYLQQPTQVILPENKLLRVNVQNIDTHSPILVVTAACGWVIPIREWEDRMESMLPERGYGIDCEDF